MAEIVSIQTAEDRRDVIHRVVQSLADGGLVALPTETAYLLTAHGLQA
ncbi:MAG: translation factor, partial [Planctomycetes bacterium]|nr:translation factor [Planctomycetota bacterium]